MTRIEAELTHLIRMSLTHPNLYEYARDKAQRLANQEPAEFGELPLLLSNELNSTKCGPPRKFTKPRSE